ncbi:carboxypeptidase-like regulatory domain-containing protein [Flagellimonas myxillae]|uniref:carboxypeptidase-like regulatory domain-containing protein n=1 Tax=Flagellimonas myxillae TaxID=2942214 RepID=UPI00201ED3A0|nr:carboxypeptidase-like regulatory domain-containing protein [Muricauda myxillae]MCL6265442.1 carboxypeptidase-like regulatory domain-containing protein [Muricauda myxillae]
MRKIVLLLAFVACSSGWAQSKIEGFIYDKTNDEPLPFCSIRIYGSQEDYTITNEDGKFGVDIGFGKDSLEVRHIGFLPKKEAFSYFENNDKLYLDTDVSSLDEVVLTAGEDKEYPYRLLFSAVEKYREKNKETNSKAFLKLTSSARNIPIEQLEGFYSSKQSLSGGILDLQVKSGRFGQNKKFAFYSLDNTKVLSDFRLFGTSGQILPQYPGNMSYDAIVRRYNVRIDECSTCNDQEVSLSFFPKKPNGRFFYGKMLLDFQQLLVKKIELGVKDPSTNTLTSINENVELTPREIMLDIAFDPMDFEKIQYLNLDFRMDFKMENVSELIKSRTFMYFYDYDSTFETPYFTKEVTFNNDYDKIIALQASNEFWESNYQFPKSFKDERSLDFMKKHGFLINYNNDIPLEDLVYAKPSVLSWRKNYRLQWEHLELYRNDEGNEKIMTTSKTGRRDVTRGKAYDSPLEAHTKSTRVAPSKEMNVSYMVDSYRDGDGATKSVSRTLMDISGPQFAEDGTRHKLAHINMVFDIYEVYRRLAATRITPEMTFDEIKAVYDEIFQGAAIEVKNMERETGRGLDHQEMLKWNSRIKSRLGVDNFTLNH